MIKTYYGKHYPHLEPAFFWDTDTVPQRERLYTASFLLVLLVIFLDSAMFATSAYFFLEAQYGVIYLSWRLALSVFAVALFLQAGLYFWIVNKALKATDYEKKLEEVRLARYGKGSKLSPAKVLEKALEFFGPGGLGLEVKEQGEGCATFEGGGGHVFVQACEKGKGSEVELETREWDYQVKQFMGKI